MISSLFACWASVLCLAEKHAGLGGWVGAGGALLAIYATWRIAQRQVRADRRLRKVEWEKDIDLISYVVDKIENYLNPFLVEARKGASPEIASWDYNFQKEPIKRSAIGLDGAPLKDWPSVDAYNYFKIYWENTNMALQNATLQKEDRLLPQIAARDAALSELRSALTKARSRVI